MRTQSKIVRSDVELFGHLVAGFAKGEIGCSIGDDADLRCAVGNDLRLGHKSARGVELAVKALEVVLVIVRTLAVLRFLVVSSTAGEVCGFGMQCARQSA